MASVWGASFGSAWGNAWGALQDQPQALASLGAAPYQRAKIKRDDDEPDEIPESISAAEITRIQSEFLSGALAHDLITRARKRKARAEEEALLLIL